MVLYLSLNYEVDLVWLCALPLVRGCIVERGVVYSQTVFTQILSGGSLCGKSCVNELVEILLCKGGDVELGARTSKRIFVFAFDPLSLALSLTLCIVHIINMLGLIVCPYLCLTKRASYSTLTLI